MYGVRANSPRPWTGDRRTLYELKAFLRSCDHLLLIDTLHRVQPRLTQPAMPELNQARRSASDRVGLATESRTTSDTSTSRWRRRGRADGDGFANSSTRS